MAGQLFTAENAAEMARRSAKSRAENNRKRKEQERIEAAPAANADEQARIKRVQKQIDRCDEMLDKCKDGELFVKLTAAKERLWNLVFPKAGVHKPKAQSRRSQMTGSQGFVEEPA